MTSKKIRVALMAYAFDNRPAKGTALYARKLVERLITDDRFEFYLVHYEKTNDPLYRSQKEIVMPDFMDLPYGTRFIRQMLFFWKYRREPFDIIHWFQPRVYPFFWLAPARAIAITAHAAGDITAPSFFNVSKLIFNFVLKHFNSKARALIAVSEFGRREIIEYYKADPKKVFVTYNGGSEDFSPINKAEAQEQIGKKYSITAPFILDVSRLQPHKNVRTLIRAYVEMRTTFPERTEKLIIVGKPVYGHEETYTLAENSAFADDIRFINYIEPEDLNALYSASELFVFPSVNEGFGLPVIEAMASGTPVITTTVTSLPEIAGDAALLVRPYDYKTLAVSIHEILSSPELRTSLVLKGLERARVFTWDTTAETTKIIYEKILQS